jgi:hypothetical protein
MVGSAKQPLLHLIWEYMRIDPDPLQPISFRPHSPSMPSCLKSHNIQQYPHRVHLFIRLFLLAPNVHRQLRERNEIYHTILRHIRPIYPLLHSVLK